MTKKLTFNEAPVWASQQTIVKILKDVKYTFEPVSQYENTQFYCMTSQKLNEPLRDKLRKIGFKKIKERYYKCPLAVTMKGGLYSSNPIVEPIVFNQSDVTKIISDVPENYVGPDVL